MYHAKPTDIHAIIIHVHVHVGTSDSGHSERGSNNLRQTAQTGSSIHVPLQQTRVPTHTHTNTHTHLQYIRTQFDLLEVEGGRCAGHERLPVAKAAVALVVGASQLAGMMAVVSEEKWLDDGLVDNGGYHRQAWGSRVHGCLVEIAFSLRVGVAVSERERERERGREGGRGRER